MQEIAISTVARAVFIGATFTTSLRLIVAELKAQRKFAAVGGWRDNEPSPLETRSLAACTR
jgi:hypothetical protein